ncbi:class-II fumarase/aspartase family protein [Parasulfitobacter algicola]|uniref:Adenylosuccinate lyase family protein n=1 Tax=Parasulfitobacter algicola TaxID=2614809 RepID=A0ABX2IUE1_9RHOB|nr:adenylosuccinate lyase family protein [Sulfitobacter algicola]NSX56175.1 adenylosuccinate lyase family protein [Sulfitobacter algicola]
MAASVYDSSLYRDLFGDADVGRLFSDTAEVRAMMLVEGALAKVQGKLGIIPELSAQAIHRASLEIQIDPGALAAETGTSAVAVPALVKAFRKEMQSPDHAQYIHWGATSQDIIDTGLVLRLRQVLTIFEVRLRAVLRDLGQLSDTHADLVMAGRTWGQVATPTTFGAVTAGWGRPLLRLQGKMPALRSDLLNVSLAGAAGTLSTMGTKGPDVRKALAQALDLSDPGGSWHSARDGITGFAAWMTQVTVCLAKMGEDLIFLSRSHMPEVSIGLSGGSSTMPQKQNPVMPNVLVAIANHVVALNSAVQGAAIHREQRDGAAWMTEWMSLPQMCMGLARALTVSDQIVSQLSPLPDHMAAGLDSGLGLIYAEALSFALTDHMPRPEAQMKVKELCKAVMETNTSFKDLATQEWPEFDLSHAFDQSRQVGQAPAEARSFSEDVKQL